MRNIKKSVYLTANKEKLEEAKYCGMAIYDFADWYKNNKLN